MRRLGQSRRFQGAVDTSSEYIEGKSARRLERHRQVEAFGPRLRDIFEMASALQRSALAILPSIHSILASPARAFSSSSDMAAGGR